MQTLRYVLICIYKRRLREKKILTRAMRMTVLHFSFSFSLFPNRSTFVKAVVIPFINNICHQTIQKLKTNSPAMNTYLQRGWILLGNIKDGLIHWRLDLQQGHTVILQSFVLFARQTKEWQVRIFSSERVFELKAIVKHSSPFSLVSLICWIKVQKWRFFHRFSYLISRLWGDKAQRVNSWILLSVINLKKEKRKQGPDFLWMRLR